MIITHEQFEALVVSVADRLIPVEKVKLTGRMGIKIRLDGTGMATTVEFNVPADETHQEAFDREWPKRQREAARWMLENQIPIGWLLGEPEVQ